jgi:hypothetical protein
LLPGAYRSWRAYRPDRRFFSENGLPPKTKSLSRKPTDLPAKKKIDAVERPICHHRLELTDEKSR